MDHMRTLQTPELPDFALLAEFVRSVNEGHPPSQAALEEAAAFLEESRKVAAEVRRQRALHRVRELRATGEYASVRAVATRVASEIGVSAETIRGWVTEAGGCHPPAESTQGLT
jgi:hypothetical protein